MKLRLGLGIRPRIVRLSNNFFDFLGLPLFMGSQVKNYKVDERLKSALARGRIVSLAGFLTPKNAVGTKKVRIGRKGDGGYVSIDTGTRVRYALSFGIETDDSWDIDCAGRGIKVYQYDYSIDQTPHQHELTEFHKKKIGPKKTESEESIASVLEAHSLTEDSSVILKIDIEGSEWGAFATTPMETLKKFDQIVCEFHNFGSIVDDAWYECARLALEKLDKVFGVVHVHANNNGKWIFPGNVPFPQVLEVTYANRGQYRLEESAETFPTELDMPNRAQSPDFYLGDFHFKGLRG